MAPLKDRKFRITYSLTGNQGTAHSMKVAAWLGWSLPVVGQVALACLAVGESATDTDGDTWTREV